MKKRVWHAKHIAAMMVFVLSVVLLLPLTANAYAGGLLSGKSLTVAGDIQSTTTLNSSMTDNDETTKFSMGASNTDSDTVYYNFTTNQTISSFKLKADVISFLHIVLYDSSNNLLADSTIVSDGVQTNFSSSYSNVRKVAIVNTAGSVRSISEFDVFSASVISDTNLLSGKSMWIGSSKTDPNLSTNGATDGVTTSGPNLTGTKNYLWYAFSSPQDVVSYSINATGSTTGYDIYYYDSNGVQLAAFAPVNLTGGSTSKVVNGISKIVVVNTSGSSATVNELTLVGHPSVVSDGELLTGKTMNIGSGFSNVSSTTTGATDADAANGPLLSSPNIYLWYSFSSPVNAVSYRLLASGVATDYAIYYFDSSGAQIAGVNASSVNGSSVSKVVSGVSKIALLNNAVGSASRAIYDFHLVGSGGDPVDTMPPPVPSITSATAHDGSTDLNWGAVSASDFKGYNVYVDGVKVTATPIAAVTYTATVTNNAVHTFQITSVDNTGNESVKSDAVTSVFDTISPLAPIGLVSNPGTDGSTLLTWTPSPEQDVAGYNVYQSASKLNTSLIVPAQYLVTGLSQSTTYSFTVTAVDTSGNESPKSSSVTYYLDSSAPGAPTDLNGVATENSVDLDWVPPADNDLAGFNVYVNGVKRNGALVSGTTYTVDGLTPDTPYTFTVRAVDTASNESGNSNAASIRTKAYTGPKAPDAPQDLKATASNEKIVLSWSDQNTQTVTKYVIYRDDVKLGETTQTQYIDITGLVNGTKYAYKVVAVNDLGESPPASNSFSPANAPDLSGTQIPLSPGAMISSSAGLLGKYGAWVLLVLGLMMAYIFVVQPKKMVEKSARVAGVNASRREIRKAGKVVYKWNGDRDKDGNRIRKAEFYDKNGAKVRAPKKNSEEWYEAHGMTKPDRDKKRSGRTEKAEYTMGGKVVYKWDGEWSADGRDKIRRAEFYNKDGERVKAPKKLSKEWFDAHGMKKGW